MKVSAGTHVQELPTGPGGVLQWVVDLSRGLPVSLEFQAGQDPGEAGRILGTLARALDMAVALQAESPKELARGVQKLVQRPLEEAAQEGRAYMCSSCGNLWFHAHPQHRVVACQACLQPLEHEAALAAARLELLGAPVLDSKDWF